MQMRVVPRKEEPFVLFLGMKGVFFVNYAGSSGEDKGVIRV